MSKCEELYDIAQVDNVVSLLPSNTLYLSGYSSTNCQIIINKTGSYFLTDMRYYSEAREKLSGRFEVLCKDFSCAEDLLCDGSVGFEADISYRQYGSIKKLCGDRKLIDVTHGISSLRDIKSQDEISCIEKAQSVTEIAFKEALKHIEAGVSEIELAAYIEYIMQKNGCELAFDSIVAFGAHTASPHAHRSDSLLADGDFIIMDIGAKYRGYCSDMTRTVGYGQISAKQAEIYNEVLAAQNLALKSLKSGMTGREGDGIVRDYFSQKGLEKYFVHSLGHGVGIDIHEGVGLSSKEQGVLKENMVVTVEPGLYIDGEFGVRIEDMALIKESSVINLTHADKQLIIL